MYFRRRLLPVLSALSLLLVAVTVTAWVRSSYVWDEFSFASSTKYFGLDSAGGQFEFEYESPVNGHEEFRDCVGLRYWVPDKVDGPVEAGARMPGSHQWFRGHGFWLVTGERWGDNHFAIYLPAWFMVMVFAALPLYRICPRPKIRFKSSLSLRTLCKSCGYDLRATPDRCPECGAVPAKQETIPG
jgi:hypothetical protein